MIGKRLIDSNYKIVNKVNLKLNVETTLKDAHISHNDVEHVYSVSKAKHSCDTPSDIQISTEHVPTALEQLDTSSAIANNISLCDFKDQIIRLNAEILKSVISLILDILKILNSKKNINQLETATTNL